MSSSGPSGASSDDSGPATAAISAAGSSSSPAPNAAAVGREFVRQYYTLLNQAPLHLHRFYSANSSFVHGGNLEDAASGEPVCGQQEIHRRIMQLNFRNCRAKIRQVDSHATLGNGVVVQVAGELSNDNRPLRRFMQTFVLAPQSHKKYYVHNDIFRYQDEVFGDSVSGGGEEAPGDAAVVAAPSPPTVSVDPASRPPQPQQQQQQPQQPVQMQPQPKSNGHEIGVGGEKEVKEAAAAAPSLVSGGPPPGMGAAPPPATAHLSGPETAGAVLAQAADTLQKQQRLQQQQQQQQQQEMGGKEENGNGDQLPGGKKPSQAPVKPHQPLQKDNSVPPTLGQQQQQQANPAPPSGPPEPMSYANLVKTRPAVAPSATNAGQNAASGGDANKPGGDQARPPHRAYSGSVSGPQSGAKPSNSSTREEDNNQVNSSRHQQQHQQPGVQAGGPPPASVYGGLGGGPPGGGGGGGPSRGLGGGGGGGPLYSDAQQLFVGNLPHNCTESDLEALFGQFGKVAEIRINNKGAVQSKSQGPSGTRIPNFGFVVFEEERAVKEALDKRPIHLPGNHRLNVEEKKNNRIRSDNSMGGDRMLSGGPMGGGPSLVMGSRGGHHHHGGYDSQGRGGGGQDYNSMGRGMIGDGSGPYRGRGGSSLRGGPMGRGGGGGDRGQFKKKLPFGRGGGGGGGSSQQQHSDASHM